MKAILEFNLPEEQEAYNDALNGWKWRKILQDLESRYKFLVKNDKSSWSSEVSIKVINELINQENLNLYE